MESNWMGSLHCYRSNGIPLTYSSYLYLLHVSVNKNFACCLQRGQGVNHDHKKLDSPITKQGRQNNIIYDG